MVPSDKLTDPERMEYFRNIPGGEPFTEGDISADYSLQLMIGYNNFKVWEQTQKKLIPWLASGVKYVVSSEAREEAKAIKENRGQMRD
jgi:hypothetical protein